MTATISLRARLAAAALALASLAALSTATAPHAAAANRAPVAGTDVSWPECPKGMGIPSRRGEGKPMPSTRTGFVVIGLTNGPGFYRNPCLSSQVAWAKRHHRLTGMYAMTTYPTSAQVRKYGTAGPWKGTDALSRLRNAGYAQATFNVTTARTVGLTNRFVWVDIEEYPVAPWTGNLSQRRAVIDGVLRGYKDAGIGVGFYSVSSHWARITGNWRPGLPLWDSVGPTSSARATARCAAPSFTGGRRVMTQWWTSAKDYNITCPGITGTTATRSPLYPHRASTVRYGQRSTAVKALQRRLGVTPTGYFGPVTRGKVLAFQKAKGLPRTGVVTPTVWKALGAHTTTPAKASVMGRYFTQY